MPLEKDGSISLAYSGLPMNEALPLEIQEMRTELRQLDRILNLLEAQARAKVHPSAMKPQFSALFNWHLSVMESFLSMTSIAFDDTDKDFTNSVARDYVRRFSMFK